MKLVDATVEGMGFAIPIEDALFYASTLEKGQSVTRPYVGIGMLDITDEYVLWQNGITLDKSITSGVAVLEIAEDSPADKAKLKKGDIIISLAGEKITSIAQFRYVLYKQKPRDTVVIEYIRDKKTIKTELTLGENNN
jgi:serine protease Do